ncbi:MAG: response regulator [Deltaproteobacteria bacterium]|nr:response regulator [Deltaproteobacteria bacterium]MCB9785679.1 response regulator [Deltaproteobacteria bacterium]
MKTILLADDEDNLRTLIHMTLSDPRYRVVEARNGAQALELTQELTPSLLVLDWTMPCLDGIEVTRALRADAKSSGIPILMLTANGGESDVELARSVGVSEYLTKPFSPLELLDTVERLLGD